MGMPHVVFQFDVPAKNKIFDKLSSNIAWYNKQSTHVRENKMVVVFYNEWLVPFCSSHNMLLNYIWQLTMTLTLPETAENKKWFDP